MKTQEYKPLWLREPVIFAFPNLAPQVWANDGNGIVRISKDDLAAAEKSLLSKKRVRRTDRRIIAAIKEDMGSKDYVRYRSVGLNDDENGDTLILLLTLLPEEKKEEVK